MVHSDWNYQSNKKPNPSFNQYLKWCKEILPHLKLLIFKEKKKGKVLGNRFQILNIKNITCKNIVETECKIANQMNLLIKE